MHYIPQTYTALCGARAASVTTDSEGRVLTFVGLTPCCGASGKGDGDAKTGVVCRVCYKEVSAKFGISGWESIREAIREARCPSGDNCADHILSVLSERSTPRGYAL